MTCPECIGDPENSCGWCSDNVTYKNGTVIGKHCAGYNEDGSTEPFKCNGIYSTVTCKFPTTTTTASTSTTTTTKPSSTGSGTGSSSTTSTTSTGPSKKKYDCNPINATCVESTNGAFNELKPCQDQCKTNPIPNDLKGPWRGLQISKNYINGEFRAVFTDKNVTVTRPDGQKFVGNVATVGSYITITVLSGPSTGKKIQTLWQVQYGPATKELTWAWGEPNKEAPKSYESAMVEPNKSVYVFVGCLPNKSPNQCNFDH